MAVAAKPVEPIVEAQSVVVQEQVQVDKETTQAPAPMPQEQSQPAVVAEPTIVEATPAVADVAPAEAPTPAAAPAPVAAPVEQKEEKATVSPAPAVQPATSASLPLCTPVAVTVHEGPAFATPKKALRDSTKLHNSPSISKKTIVASSTADAENLHRSPACGAAAVSQEKTKRVAFAKRVENEGPKGKKAAAKKDMKMPRSAKSAKAHRQANVDEDRMKQMQMAFQRLLTNAAHLDYQLATR